MLSSFFNYLYYYDFLTVLLISTDPLILPCSPWGHKCVNKLILNKTKLKTFTRKYFNLFTCMTINPHQRTANMQRCLKLDCNYMFFILTYHCTVMYSHEY